MQFSVSARLHQDFERVSPAIDRTPEPVLLLVDRDHNFVLVPVVGGLGAITQELGRNLRSKFCHPISGRLMADGSAASCQKILNILQAEGETAVGPDGIANSQTWKAIALQGQGRGQSIIVLR
ncbi:hypothetical protein P775_01630 [Puniceibacterium antarcticum]|uniref:Uncharacterized protein n=1 Tax=Puniceibacterium antarcticum TaxID=1206336 RepID=A0A2G8RKA1_9RHOB|nr:hypothetical protein P775_01630 [Puniceibacterium antarcticum]